MLGFVSSCLTIKEQLDCTNVAGGDSDGASSSSDCHIPIRITIKYNNKTESVAWYGTETPLNSIESAVRSAFNLPKKMRFFLRNITNDVVPLSHNLPPSQTYTLLPSFNDCSKEDSESESDADSDSSSEEESDADTSPLPPPRVDHTPMVATVTYKKPIPAKQSIVEILHTNSSEIKTYPVPDGAPEITNSAKRELIHADDKKKRKRRKAVEIERTYKCSAGSCHKVYGSENALKMHIKLKHPDFINIAPMVMMHSQMPPQQPPQQPQPSQQPQHSPRQVQTPSPPYSYRPYPVPPAPTVAPSNFSVRYPVAPSYPPSRIDIAELTSPYTVPPHMVMHHSTQPKYQNGQVKPTIFVDSNTPPASPKLSSVSPSPLSLVSAPALPSIHSITNNLPISPHAFHFAQSRNIHSLNAMSMVAEKN